MRSRDALTLAALAAATALAAAPGAAQAAPHRPVVSRDAVTLTVERSIALDRGAVGNDFFVTAPVPGRHQLYVFGLTNDGYAPALIDTAADSVTPLHDLATNGFYDPGSHLVYGFTGGPAAPPAAPGIQVIRDTKTVASSTYYGVDGTPTGPGAAVVVGTPDGSYPRSSEVLLRYRGSALLSTTPMCADEFTLGYLPQGDLTYVICRPGNPPTKEAQVEIFRGATLVDTISDLPNARWVAVDQRHGLAYISSSHSIRVYDGTTLLTSVHSPDTVGLRPPVVDDVTGQAFVNTGRASVTLVLDRTGLIATKHFPAGRVAINEGNGLAYFGHKSRNGWITRVVRGTKLIGTITDQPHAKLRRYDPVSGDMIVTTPRTVMLMHGTEIVARHHVPGTSETVHVTNVNSNRSTHELYVIARASDPTLVVFREAS